MILRFLRAVCPFCLTRDIHWHSAMLGPRYYDSGFHEFCAQCQLCFSIYDHPEQSGSVENGDVDDVIADAKRKQAEDDARSSSESPEHAAKLIDLSLRQANGAA